jgi:hypothetical protein
VWAKCRQINSKKERIMLGKEESVQLFVDAMKKHLEKEGVKVSEETLKKGLEEARQQYEASCEHCTNGWRW